MVDALVPLLDHRGGPLLLLSPEAEAAHASWQAVAGSLEVHLARCSSGRELAGKGWADDVSVAGELDSSTAVPVLRDGVFRDQGPAVPSHRPEPSLADGSPEG